jgi:hypothetical protein
MSGKIIFDPLKATTAVLELVLVVYRRFITGENDIDENVWPLGRLGRRWSGWLQRTLRHISAVLAY